MEGQGRGKSAARDALLLRFIPEHIRRGSTDTLRRAELLVAI